jgi:ankyrin repeat protein
MQQTKKGNIMKILKITLLSLVISTSILGRESFSLHEFVVGQESGLHQSQQVKYSLNNESRRHINAQNRSGKTELMFQASSGDIIKVKHLLNEHKGLINVNLPDNRLGKTALMFAAQGGWGKTIKCLVKNGADMDLQDEDGNNALMYAISSGYSNAVWPLMRTKNINAQNNQGKTALMIAVAGGWGNLPIIEALVAKNSIDLAQLENALESAKDCDVKKCLQRAIDYRQKGSSFMGYVSWFIYRIRAIFSVTNI